MSSSRLPKLTAVLLALALTGCADLYSIANTYGKVFEYKTYPLEVTENEGPATKSSSGSFVTILWFLNFGKVDTKKLAAESGITKVQFIDKTKTTIFFVYQKTTITVYGE